MSFGEAGDRAPAQPPPQPPSSAPVRPGSSPAPQSIARTHTPACGPAVPRTHPPALRRVSTTVRQLHRRLAARYWSDRLMRCVTDNTVGSPAATHEPHIVSTAGGLLCSTSHRLARRTCRAAKRVQVGRHDGGERRAGTTCIPRRLTPVVSTQAEASSLGLGVAEAAPAVVHGAGDG